MYGVSVVLHDESVFLGVQRVVEVSEGDVEEGSVLFTFPVEVGFVVGHGHSLAVHPHDDVRVLGHGEGLDLVFAQEYFHGLEEKSMISTVSNIFDFRSAY